MMEPIQLHLETDFFKPESLKETQIIPLFDGAYTLTVGTYKTREGAWDYTWGLIKNQEGKLIASVQRSYGSFFYSPLGDHLLVVGQRYDQFSILDLKARTYRTVEYDQFCWTGASLSPNGKTLVVWGCFWACPSEYRFYDLGGPEIKALEMNLDGETYIDLCDDEDEEEDPVSISSTSTTSIKWEGDDRLVWTKKILYYTDLMMRYNKAEQWASELYPMEGWNDEIYDQRMNRLEQGKRELRVDEVVIVERQGDQIVQVGGEISEDLQKERREQNAYRAYDELRVKVWKEQCSIYQALKEKFPQASLTRSIGSRPCLYFTPGNGYQVQLEMKFKSLNWSEEEVIERFTGEVSEETRTFISKSAVYDGLITIKKKEAEIWSHSDLSQVDSKTVLQQFV